MDALHALDHRATITQRLAVQISQRIFAGDYPPGGALREVELAAHYDVSRHVIREVLRTLAADGLVDYASFRGARVPVLSIADARDIYRARRLVESGDEAMSVLPDASLIGGIHRKFAKAVKAADWELAFDLDVAFHEAIVGAAGSARMSAWLAGLLKDLRLAHLVAPSFNGQAFIDSVAQHGEIVAALEANDAARARKAMKRHLDAAECALIEDMARSQN